MRMSILTAVVLVPALGLAACASDPETSPQPRPDDGSNRGPAATDLETVRNVPILSKATGEQLEITDASLILVDQPMFETLGLAGQGVDPDFADRSVILLSLGEQPTGGYAADITAIQRRGDTLFVQGTATRPTEEASLTQQLTYPFCIVVIEKLPEEVTLRSDITSQVR